MLKGSHTSHTCTNLRSSQGYSNSNKAKGLVTNSRKGRGNVANFDNNTRRRLAPAEMEEKRSKGLCFFCDEKYSLGHKCKAKRHFY